MAATPYKPTSWNDLSLHVDKLKQMSNNDQWLFEHITSMRYAAPGVTKDTGLKMIVGKTAFPTSNRSWIYIDVYFGSFFSANSRIIVNATIEPIGTWHRHEVTVHGYGGEIDHRGFRAAVYVVDGQTTIPSPGFIHWQAVGY